MRSLPLLSLFVILTASTAACDGDDAEAITFEQLPGRVASSFCKNTFRCCDATEIMDRFNGANPPITTEAECITNLTTLYQGLFGQLNEAIMAGRLGYNGGAAGNCLSALDGAACGAASANAQDECEVDVFYGKVAVGGQCKDSDECVDDGVCNGATDTMFGACAARPGIGQACDGSCVDGAFCDLNSMCVAEKANGTACDFSFECASGNCDANSMCAPEPASTECDGV